MTNLLEETQRYVTDFVLAELNNDESDSSADAPVIAHDGTEYNLDQWRVLVEQGKACEICGSTDLADDEPGELLHYDEDCFK